MKPFKIENAKTRFFESKEQYQQFTQAWKDFHNTEPLAEWKDVDIRPYSNKKPKTPIRAKFSKLGAEHYMLYNLLRGYDVTRGFSPLTREGRLNAHKNFGGEPDPWWNTKEAANNIIRCARDLEDINSPSDWSRKFARNRVNRLMKPFGETVSYEVLAELAGILYEYISDGQILPKIIVEEPKVIEDKVVEKIKPPTFRQKIMAWGKSQ